MKLGTSSTLMLASSLTVMAGAMVAPSLPGLRDHFAGEAQVDLLVRLVLTMPALAVVLSGPLVGWLVDRVGSRSVLLGGLVIYGAGGTSGLWLPGLPAILAGRFVLGLGVAAVMTAATAFIAELTQGAARGRFMGYQAAFMGLGGLVFLSSGGALADLHWSWPFATYAVAWLLVPAVALVLPAHRPAEADRAAGWRIPGPVWMLYLAGFLGMLLFYLAPVQLPFLLDRRLEAGGLAVGLALGGMTVFGTTASFSFQIIHRRLGSVGVLVLTFACVSPGLAMMGWAHSWPAVMAGLASFGFGVGLLMPNLNLWAAGLAPEAMRGRVLGGLNTAFFLGQFLSPFLASPVLALGGSLGQLFLISAGLAAILAASAALFMRRLAGPDLIAS